MKWLACGAWLLVWFILHSVVFTPILGRDGNFGGLAKGIAAAVDAGIFAFGFRFIWRYFRSRGTDDPTERTPPSWFASGSGHAALALALPVLVIAAGTFAIVDSSRSTNVPVPTPPSTSIGAAAPAAVWPAPSKEATPIVEAPSPASEAPPGYLPVFDADNGMTVFMHPEVRMKSLALLSGRGALSLALADVWLQGRSGHTAQRLAFRCDSPGSWFAVFPDRDGRLFRFDRANSSNRGTLGFAEWDFACARVVNDGRG